MSLPTDVQVLIVGAGPTGLISAITLSTLGIQVAVVDSSPTNRNGSRASTVHAHTLEVLDTIGLAQPLIDAGIRSKGVLFRGTTNKLFEFDISQLRDETKFPMSVHIPQDEVERIFGEKLASQDVQVLRNNAVVGMREVASTGVEVSFEDGSVIRTQYVIGADGSRSTIRRLCGIEFRDPHTGAAYDDATVPASLHLVLADVHLKEPLPTTIPRDRLSAHLDNFLMFVPFRENQVSKDNSTSFWRIAYGIPNGDVGAPHNPSLEHFQEEMDKRNPWDTKITIESVTMSSRYRVRSAVASKFFQKVGGGNIILIGDAAHVHSPAGGQGMNLGICDAVAAAQAIHSHINGRSGDEVLQSYADSRRTIAIRVIGLASGLSYLIDSGIGWRRPIRNFALLILRNLPYVNRIGAWRVSGLVNRTD